MNPLENWDFSRLERAREYANMRAAVEVDVFTRTVIQMFGEAAAREMGRQRAPKASKPYAKRMVHDDRGRTDGD